MERWMPSAFLKAIPGVDFIVVSGSGWKIWNPQIYEEAESAYSTSCTCTSNNRAFTKGKETMVVPLPKMGPKPGMDEKAESERGLPEEMLEAIVVRMPFPSLFKARVLSKSWYFKLTDFSCEVSAFQRQISTNSASWRTYAPVLINWTNMSLLATASKGNFNDRSKSQWFVLPRNMWHDIRFDWVDGKPNVWLAGALVLMGGMVESSDYNSNCTSIFSVVNVVTGSWRHLKLAPQLGSQTWAFQGPLSFIAVGCNSFKVLSVYSIFDVEGDGIRTPALCVNLYDSTSQIWTSTRNNYNDVEALHDLLYFYQNCAYINGKVYFLARCCQYEGWLGLGKVKLVSYDLENTAWTIAPEGFADSINPWMHDVSGVFRCGHKIIVVIMCNEAMSACHQEIVEEGFWIGKIRAKSIQVFQLDMQSLELVSISNGPPEITVLLKISEFGPNPTLSADANFLYLCWDCFPSSMLKFDLNSQKWSLIPLASSGPDFDWTRHQLGWIHGALEPGLNPFVWAG